MNTFNFSKTKKAADLSSVVDLRRMYKSLGKMGFEMPSDEEIQHRAKMCGKSIAKIRSINL